MKPREDGRCSFCGKARADVGTLVAGPLASICEGCVEMCERTIADADRAAASQANLSELARMMREVADELDAIRAAKPLGERTRELAMAIFAASS